MARDHRVPGSGEASQPSVPAVVRAEEKGFAVGEQEIDYDYQPIKVRVVNEPERKDAECAFQVGMFSIAANLTVIPALLVSKKTTRRRLLIDNLGPDDIYFSHERNVTDQNGWRIQAADNPVEMLYAKEAVFVTTLDGTKNARIQILEEFEVPYKA